MQQLPHSALTLPTTTTTTSHTPLFPPRLSLRPCSASSSPCAQGFKVEFTFSENPFFTNTTLSKTFHIKDMVGEGPDDKEAQEGEEEDEEDDKESVDGVQKIEGTDINWKAGKNLTVKWVTKKGKGKKAKAVRKEEEVPSFFRFFDTPSLEIDEEDPDAVSCAAPPYPSPAPTHTDGFPQTLPGDDQINAWLSYRGLTPPTAEANIFHLMSGL
jgi:hypothetical protein